MIRKKLKQQGWVIAAIPAVAALLYLAGVLAPLQTWISDQRFRAGSRPAISAILLVDIDAKSLTRIGVWPWPRAVHAALTDRLSAAGARTIGFDIDFSSVSEPGNDAAFADALQRAGGTVLLAVFNQPLTNYSTSTDLAWNRPIPILAARSWPAHVNVISDRNGTVRAIALAQQHEGDVIPAMAALLAGGSVDISGTATIDYSIDPRSIDRISAIDLLEGRVPASQIAGRSVLVGAAALELRDVFQVPVHGLLSGPLIQALATETIVQNRSIAKVAPAAVYFGLALLAGFGVLLWRLRDWRVAAGLTGAAAFAVEATSTGVQVLQPLSFESAPFHVALAGFALATIFREIYQRRILLNGARNREGNTRRILDRVVADNYAGVLVVDDAGMVRAMSREASEILGCHDLTGRPLSEAQAPSLSQAVDRILAAALAGEDPTTVTGETHHDAGGALKRLDYTLTLSPLGEAEETKAGAVACLTFRDVTEERKAQERLAYMARNDVLTGLMNRHAFVEKLDGLLEGEAESVAVLFLDLDRFKTINDTLGHSLGDALLCAVADRLKSNLGPEVLTSRFGGDEFVVALPGSSRGEALAISNGLVENLSRPFDLDNHRLAVGVSVGCALAQDAPSSADLIKNADTALYKAKSSGGNGVVLFETSMDAPMRARQAMELDLWRAFDDWQFELVYQPQVEIDTRQVTGAEVLLRWPHPELGYISPADFIPVAEAIGLIEQLGKCVLRRACTEAASWPEYMKISVNVSPSQFVRGDLYAEVMSALAASGLSPDRLDLEITESLFIHDRKAIEDTMNRLRAIGVTFSIDDFGTGYSSLSYIRRFPVDKIKIDRSFVAGLPAEQDSVAIVSAVVAMARSLNLRVNAEGVETQVQADALRLLGCDEGQGWLFGKPQSAADLMRLVAEPSLAPEISAVA